MTEVKPSPITVLRPKPAEAVRYDGSPEVLAILAEWDADPTQVRPDIPLRVWGPRDGYAGALIGDWLVRESYAGAFGVARYDPEAFAERYEDPASPDGSAPGDGELIARALLLQQAQDAIAFERERANRAEALIADALETIGNFLGQYGHSEIDMFRVAQDLANSLRKTLGGARDGRRPEDQPLPKPTDGPSMHDLVIDDIRKAYGASAGQAAGALEARKRLGLARYGQLLQAGNGRDALRDLLEELQDAAVYCRQVIEENQLERDQRATMRVTYEALLSMLLRVHEARDPEPRNQHEEAEGDV
jgi:hypothetical protein